ncbi:MAG: FAD-binding oxidoreductase [Gammaproteobacteria bacterium]|nr:FAD-binding oxidoreductase [Gammaproteobacteria bacterium]
MRNWEESIDLKASTVVHAQSVADIIDVVTDPSRYPSPVRTAGSRHSTTHCGVCDGGTLLVTRKMDRIIDIDTDAQTVTVEAGALYIDVAKALEAVGFQFFVNVEIGNLTMGSAACTGTKDASMPGEKGQVCSYCIGMKLVLASGQTKHVTEAEPLLLQAARSGYGLLGAVYEVTFRIKPLQAMSVYHRTYTLDEFEAVLPELQRSGRSIMYYLFPFLDSITVEFRQYVTDTPPSNRWMWKVRNLFWKTLAPSASHLLTRFVRPRPLRNAATNMFYRCIQIIMNVAMRSNATYAGDQLIRYPERKGFDKYTFSIWAFDEKRIVSTMRAYYQFCRDYDRDHGYRCDMLNVGYRIEKDTNPLLSYSFDGTVMTLDPVCTGREPGWDDFLRAYNEFCSEHGGVPLFNQSKWLSRRQVDKAFGSRLAELERYRSRLDPRGRFINDYFRDLLAAGQGGEGTQDRRASSDAESTEPAPRCPAVA